MSGKCTTKPRNFGLNRGDEVVILNQFDEFGNAVWHYVCTGRAMEEVFGAYARRLALRRRLSDPGFGGNLGSADYLREKFPRTKVVAAEALQCPTLL